MKIDKNSYGTIALVYLISAAIVILLSVCNVSPWIYWPVVVIAAYMCLWQTYFFRVPNRERCGDDKTVTSVADGKVVIIEKIKDDIFLGKECIQVSVYMNFFDVHANFWPVDGNISFTKYFPGEHFLAFKPKASEENEHTCTTITTEDGQEVLFKQLAGTFARRIVSYAKVGDSVRCGEQCGIIKFGSRIDMYLPLDCEIMVKLGDKVRACETVIAQLR